MAYEKTANTVYTVQHKCRSYRGGKKPFVSWHPMESFMTYSEATNYARLMSGAQGLECRIHCEESV